MSEQKHRYTPGPWEVNPFVARVDCIEPSKLGGLLPVCQMLHPTDERSEYQTEANARLIAAAPELLEALVAAERRLVDLYRAIAPRANDRETVGSRFADSDEAVKRARDVIAKALGE